VKDPTRPVPRSRADIERLLAIAERDLGQSRMQTLHLDTTYSLAYNAALQLATAVLGLHGVRVRKMAFHQQTFAELKPRLPDAMQSLADYFERARRKRNAAAYDRVNVVGEGEVTDLIRQVEVFQAWAIGEAKQRWSDAGVD